MVIPAAMNVETAVDMLRHREPKLLTDQTKEFLCGMGASTCARLGLKYPLSDEVIIGYRLGLETARAVIAGSAEMAIRGVNTGNVL